LLSFERRARVWARHDASESRAAKVPGNTYEFDEATSEDAADRIELDSAGIRCRIKPWPKVERR